MKGRLRRASKDLLRMAGGAAEFLSGSLARARTRI